MVKIYKNMFNIYFIKGSKYVSMLKAIMNHTNKMKQSQD